MRVAIADDGRACQGRPDIAGNGDAGREQFAIVSLIFHRDAFGNRLATLETGGRLKIGALLAAVQFDAALGAVSGEIRGCGECRSATETPGGGNTFHQARKPRTGDIERQLGLRGTRAVVVPPSAGSGATAGVLVSLLTIFAVVVHEMEKLLKKGIESLLEWVRTCRCGSGPAGLISGGRVPRTYGKHRLKGQTETKG
jgi:hypothetical protein